MENTYARLEGCIMRFFSTTTEPGAFTDDDSNLFTIAIRECNEAFRKKVVCYAFSGASRKQIGLLIQQIQHQLLLLAEKIEKSIHFIGPLKNATTSYKYSLAYVTELIEQQISFLEENFPQYLTRQENRGKNNIINL
ncbi:MAG: hypothetical protein V4717_11235 [Bacteroidota bacterium]